MKNTGIQRIAATVLAVAMLFTGTATNASAAAKSESATNASISRPKEVKGIWFSYLEMQTMLTGKTEAEFRKNMQQAFKNTADMGLNTVYVQVRPFGDALYDSAFFPWSHLITGTEGENLGFDPLEIMVAEAHSKGLLIEAWVNPYRVRAAGPIADKKLSSDNQASKWLKEKDRSVVQKDKLITYNPASTKAQNLIVNGVKEIVENYAIDGIHIDDYFYPVTDTSFDKVEYDEYVKGGGKQSLGNWRRANVETLLKKMYKAIKAANANVIFGISPQSNIDSNYSTHYLDVKKIAASDEYCDYLAPQVYFGFNNEVQPFAETFDKWDDIIQSSKIDLYVGIASYKVGKADSYAKKGAKEWQTNSDLSARMIKHSRTANNYDGFILYRYEHVFKPANDVKERVAKENANIKKELSK